MCKVFVHARQCAKPKCIFRTSPDDPIASVKLMQDENMLAVFLLNGGVNFLKYRSGYEVKHLPGKSKQEGRMTNSSDEFAGELSPSHSLHSEPGWGPTPHDHLAGLTAGVTAMFMLTQKDHLFMGTLEGRILVFNLSELQNSATALNCKRWIGCGNSTGKICKLPTEDSVGSVVSMCSTETLLICGTSDGTLSFILLSTLRYCGSYRFSDQVEKNNLPNYSL